MVNALSSLEVDIKDDDGVKRQSEFEKSRRTFFFGCHCHDEEHEFKRHAF
jgi:hypothetical protein